MEQETAKFKSHMHSLAFGEAMLAAARDYKTEMKAAEHARAEAAKGHRVMDMQELADELADDPDLERIYEQRMAAIRQEQEERQKMQASGHGQVTEVEEKDFLDVVTKTRRVVVHFFHREFERCKIMDKHLVTVARKYFKTRFVKISAPDSPFFVEKLKVRMLPCVVFFLDGVAVDRVVGFDELGAKDDFKTEALEAKLLGAGVVEYVKEEEDSDGEEREQRTRIRKGGEVGGVAGVGAGAESEDESSDFD